MTGRLFARGQETISLFMTFGRCLYRKIDVWFWVSCLPKKIKRISLIQRSYDWHIAALSYVYYHFYPKYSVVL